MTSSCYASGKHCLNTYNWKRIIPGTIHKVPVSHKLHDWLQCSFFCCVIINRRKCRIPDGNNAISITRDYVLPSPTELKKKKIIIGWGFCDMQNNQGWGRDYQLKLKAEADNQYWDLDYSGYHKDNLIIALLHIEWKQKWMSYFCFFTDSKQHKVCELDRNHAPRSYMTWLPFNLSVLDMIIVQSATR